MRRERGFASDNNAGVHPAVMRAMLDANTGHAVGYGADPHTARALGLFREVFGQETEAFFVFLGTAANVLGLAAVTRPHHAVICAGSAHIHVDECGAPERMAGCKLLAVPVPDGKLRPGDVTPLLRSMDFEHHNLPRVVSVTQCTELGTVYGLDEVRALADVAHARGLYLHMDGARLANACAALGVGLREATAGCGVDVLSFGGTKNGMMYGEAVVFFRPELAREFKFVRKQGMQLASKMRYIAAQFTAMLEGELWLENARHANAMARLLAEAVDGVPGVAVSRPVASNAVFARMPAHAVAPLQEAFFFYVWDPDPLETPEVRWMCSFDTTPEDVAAFAAELRRLVAG
ncbi:MAG: low specificity L-threonine aldolase [Desulfovibrionaceae bacterium]